MVSLKVDWNVLKPKMDKCNEQFNVNLEIPKDPDKGFRHKNDVRMANSANRGSRLVRGIKQVLCGIIIISKWQKQIKYQLKHFNKVLKSNLKSLQLYFELGGKTSI